MSYSENDSEELQRVYLDIGQLMFQRNQNEEVYSRLTNNFGYILNENNRMKNSELHYEQHKATYTAEQNQIEIQSKTERKANLDNLVHQFQSERTNFVYNFLNIITNARNVLNVIINNHLANWRKNQKLVGNGWRPIDPIVLNKIQFWCENLATLLWDTRRHVKLAPMYEQLNDEVHLIPKLLEEYLKKVQKLLMDLILQTVIVEVQPPQILSTKKCFVTSIRLLIGRALNIKEFECEVSILSEQEVHFYRNLQTKTKLNSRDLLKCSGKFEFNEDTCKLVALFDKMELKEIVRSKNEAAIVADEKMALLFQSTFKIGELDEVFDIYVPFLSMPVVVTVHTIQNPNSIATILWDNSFQIPNRQLFEVESSVSWECLGEALKMKFCAPKSNPVSVVPDAEIFSKEILQFLCKKALSQPNASTITWVKFCKDCLPDRIFTFWEWFYGAMKLIREHLCDLWNKNYILGFIDKLSAEQLLLESSPGTFLLRFSDSQIGKLTIASVNLDANSLKKVVHIQPMNFNNPRSLADFILSISQLKTLYPKTEKAVAFGNVSSKVTLVKGYVPIGLQLATDAPIPGASTINGQEDVNNLNENSSIRSPITSEDEPMVLENEPSNINMGESNMEMDCSNTNDLPSNSLQPL